MKRIFLIGPMGSGKTTVGQLLAQQLHRRFVDLDSEIERRCGVDVRTIFDIEGEAGFRSREHLLLDELSQHENTVLATGGGTVLAPANRELLRQRGFVVWLDTTVDQQIKRLERDQRRPLLQRPDRREVLVGLATERNQLYGQCAHLRVHSADVTPARMAENVERLIQKQLNARTSP